MSRGKDLCAYFLLEAETRVNSDEVREGSVFVGLNVTLSFIKICIYPRRQLRIVISSRINLYTSATHSRHSLKRKCLNL